MEASLTEITGSEEPRGDGSVLDVLVGFYRASNARNLDALAANWATGDVPSMDNPIGGIRRRWQSISEGYAKLFGGPAVVRVTFYDFTSQRWERLASLRRAREGQLPHARCQDSSPHSNNPAGTPRSTVFGVNFITMDGSMSPRCSPIASKRSSVRRWAVARKPVGLPCPAINLSAVNLPPRLCDAKPLRAEGSRV
jgi:hypothetical protein